MLARKRLTLSRFVNLGAVALLIFLLLLLSKHHPLDLSTLNPVHILPSFLQPNRFLFAASSDQFLKKQKISSLRECQLYSLAGGTGLHGGEKPAVQCRRVLPVPGSCDVADKLFHSGQAARCDGQVSMKLCSITSTDSGNSAQCRPDQCDSTLSGAVIDVHTGRLQWKRFDSCQTLEKWINKLLLPSSDEQKHFGFCFIGCGGDWTDVDGKLYDLQDDDDLYMPFDAIQILILPPQVPSGDRVHSHTNLNFNLIFVDSVSRQHFFRSLPNTLKVLEDLRNSNVSGMTVLDFELVQAVRSRTFETLQMLFSGEVDPSVKPFGVLELPPEPLKTEVLLRKLKKKGYSTLWLEDLCCMWEWGLAKDLLVCNKSLTTEQTWKKLQQALRQAGIDSLEMTYAMCKLLKENGVPDHFHGPDAVCLNGYNQHDYLLDYMELYQLMMIKTGTPFFTFLETNVGHEDSGKRVQTFDLSFQRYLKGVSELKNTLTIIFSDHGNSYGAYIKKSMEARMELFHPFLFILIPESVAAVLGPAAMKALHINQHRLVSHLDLHYTLQSLAYNHQNRVSDKHSQYNVSSEGLLNIVSASRGCHQIPRIMPNLCICENFEMPADNDAYHALFAHMAISRINNEIQHQFQLQTQLSHSEPKQGFGRCHRLVLGAFDNVRKSFSGTTILLKMDVLVPLEDLDNDTKWDVEYQPLSQQMEIFFVSMVVKLSGGNASQPNAIMGTLDRITPYSKFSVCADPMVKLQLCVCDVNGTHKSKQDVLKTSGEEHSLFLRPEVFVAEGTQECLQLIVRKNKHGGLFSVANVCTGKVFQVVFSLQTSEMIVSDAMPRQESVFPGQELFLCMAVKNAPKADWDWSFTLHHREESL